MLRSLEVSLLMALLSPLPALADPSPAYLVKDVDTTPTAFPFPGTIRDAGSTVYLAGGTLESGLVLWKSDGTGAGTVRVMDPVPGAPSNPFLFESVGAGFLFGGQTWESGRELWKTDGTTAGTSLVKDIFPGSGSSIPPGSETAFALVDGTLYFAAVHPSHGTELWRSDSSTAGTVLVADIVPGVGSGSPQQLTGAAGMLYFTAWDGAHTGVWKSDGTAPGTTRLVTLAGGVNAVELVNANGTLFFTSDDAKLWTSDGTSAGTAVVRSFTGFVEKLTNADGTLYFSASDDGANRDELWKSDGTPSGTLPVHEIEPGVDDTFLVELTAAGDRAYFTSAQVYFPFDAVLWTSDGTSAGTLPLLSLATDDFAEEPELHAFASLGDTLYFGASEAPDDDVELWKSDGTPEGTVRVADILPGPMGSHPDRFEVVDGSLWFAATGPLDRQFWKTDGTAAGTLAITAFVGTESSQISDLADVGGRLYFSLGAVDEEPWASDGTSAGTALLKDIRVGPQGSLPGAPTVMNDSAFFAADDGVSGRELWKSDGTSAGTLLVKDIWAGWPQSGNPQFLTDVGGTLFFAAKEGASGVELWKSDGITTGTVLVKDLVPGSLDSNPGVFANLNGTAFFTTINAGPPGFWRSDGTPAGTVKIGDFAAFATRGVNGSLYFNRTTPEHGSELWKSDGTPTGTVLVKDIRPGASGSNATPIGSVNGMLLLSANDGTHGRELWTSDGTSAGTVLVKDVVPGAAGFDSFCCASVIVGDTYFFVATTPANGTELWKSDGTEAGTAIVKELFAGPESGVLSTSIVDAGGIVVFSGIDPASGQELWATDGSAENTHLVADIAPGVGSSTPSGFLVAGSRVFFRARTDATGTELFAVPVAALMDSDLDGLDYAAETAAGTDPFVADTDGDGLGDGAEVSTHGTDPTDADTDNDGFDDREEIEVLGSDPLDPQDPGGGPNEVPLSGPLGLGLLAAALLATRVRRTGSEQTGSSVLTCSRRSASCRR